MPARVISAAYSTLIGTSQQIAELLNVLRGTGAAVIDLTGSNFVVLEKPLAKSDLVTALTTTPQKQR